MMENGKVLIVDDNKTNLDLLSHMCTKNHYQVSEACNGHLALEKIKNSEFDVVLLDIMMPGISGISVLSKIREQYSISDLPVIMITSIGQSENIAQAFELGANDYIIKPLNRSILIARVGVQLALRHTHEQLSEQLYNMTANNTLLRTAFDRYMTREVADKLLNTNRGSVIDSELRKLTIMFTDIRGFTALSEQLPVNDVMLMLNNYLEHMILVVHQYGGYVNQFTGDGLMVIFGAPNDHPDNSERALACSLEMQRCMQKVNEYNLQHGFPNIGMGIGIDAGQVMLGNIGSKARAHYSVIGKHVNLAARIVAMAEEDQVLVSENLISDMHKPVCVFKSKSVKPKGIERDINIYELEGMYDTYKLG